MALYVSGQPIANVETSDTFNSWRITTNQMLENGTFLTSNNVFTGSLNTFNNATDFKGLVTAAKITANSLDVSGDVNFTGNTTFVNTTILETTDGLLHLAANNEFADTLDIGFFGHYNLTGANSHAGFFRDSGTKEFYVFGRLDTTAGNEPNTNINILDATFELANVHIDVVKANQIAANGTITAPTINANNFTGTFSGDGSALTGTGSTVLIKSDSTAYNVTFTNQLSGPQANTFVNTGFTFNPSTGQCNATDFNATSDITLKENLSPIDNAIELVSNLTGYTFDWKNQERSSIGVTAQDVEKILPQLVTQLDEHKSVNYNGIIGVLIQAIKELNTKIDKLNS